MSFEIFRNIASAAGPEPLWPAISPTPQTPIRFNRDIDSRIQELLKHVPLTLPYHTFTQVLLEHHQKNFIPYAYLQHIEGLKATTIRIDITLEKEKLYRHELEHLLIDMGTMIKSMVHHTPPKNRTHKESKIHTERFIRSIIHITRTHHVLIARLRMIDEHPEKLETKKLTDILKKINYYLEFKRVQAEGFITEKVE